MTPRPPEVTAAVFVLFVQAIVNVRGGLRLIGEITDRTDYNQEVPTESYLFGWGWLGSGAALAVCAVFLLQRVNVARLPVVLLEGLLIVVGFMNLIAGAPQAVIGIALAVIVLLALLNRRTEDWFSPARSA